VEKLSKLPMHKSIYIFLLPFTLLHYFKYYIWESARDFCALLVFQDTAQLIYMYIYQLFGPYFWLNRGIKTK